MLDVEGSKVGWDQCRRDKAASLYRILEKEGHLMIDVQTREKAFSVSAYNP